MTKRTIVLLLVLCTLVSFTGCVKTPAPDSTTSSASTSATPPATVQEDPSETGTLNLVWAAQTGTDSIFESPYVDRQCLYPMMVFDTLLRTDADGVGFVKKLASDYSISEDGLTYTLTIREGVKWHDGQPFTADDVIFTFHAGLTMPKAPLNAMFTNVTGAKAVVEGTSDSITGVTVQGNVITIKFDAPDNSFLDSLTRTEIFPKHLLGDVDIAEINTVEAFWKKPVGTGQYYIDEVSFPNYFTVQRFDDYYGPKAGIKKCVYTSYATGGNDAQAAALVAGSLDYAYGNAVNDINLAKNLMSQNASLEMMLISSGYTRFLWVGTAGPAKGGKNADLDKPEVRQALNLIVDKQAIADFYAGQAVAATTLVNPGNSMYNADIPLFERDVDKAVQMLKDANFDFSKALRLLYYYTDSITADIMEIIKQNFAEAGIKVEPFLASGDLNSLIYEQRDWELCYGATASLLDPAKLYLTLVPGMSGASRVFAQEEERSVFTDIMTRYSQAMDTVDRKKYGDELQAANYELAYSLPVYHMNKVVIYNKDRLLLDESVFALDMEQNRDYRFESWRLLG